jgi:ABC-type molybdate transport system substrate-binding protein
MRSLKGALWSLALALYLTVASPSAAAADVTAFAAASLKDAMDEQAKQFEGSTGNKVIVSYGASNALAKQIEAAAPADIFISADLDWMDYLDQRHLLAPNTRVNLLRNTLVLIAPFEQLDAQDRSNFGRRSVARKNWPWPIPTAYPRQVRKSAWRSSEFDERREAGRPRGDCSRGIILVSRAGALRIVYKTGRLG